MDYLVYRHKKTAPWGGGGGLYQRYLNVVIDPIGDAALLFDFFACLLLRFLPHSGIIGGGQMIGSNRLRLAPEIAATVMGGRLSLYLSFFAFSRIISTASSTVCALLSMRSAKVSNHRISSVCVMLSSSILSPPIRLLTEVCPLL